MRVLVKIGVLVEKEGHLLLIREWSERRRGYFWNIVKGTLDNPEEGVLQCAVRECVEETGAQVSVRGVASIFYSKAKRVQINLLANFVRKVLPIKPLRKQKGEEIIETKWVSRGESQRMKGKEFINKRSFIAVRLWARGVSAPLDVLREIDG
ncbi:MAG: NUDIX hydrolase [Patescibacteria group bacterium]|nr:NUDIX hydrolase [Patescibacteria group bacterium]